MQTKPRLLVNLPVKLSRTLVNLLVIPVKLTKNEPLMGAMGGAPLCQFQLPSWVRGIHSGEARTLGRKNNRPWANPPKASVHAGTIGKTMS